MREYLLDNLGKVLQLFKIKGVKKLNLEEIAEALEVSKKTVYKYLGNKEKIVNLVIEHQFHSRRKRSLERLTQFVESNKNAVELVATTARLFLDDERENKASYFDDLREHYPSVMQRMKDLNGKFAKEVFPLYIKYGIEGGFFRKDLNYDFLMPLFLSSAELVDNKLVGKEFVNNSAFQEAFLRYCLSSFLTEKGRDELERIILFLNK